MGAEYWTAPHLGYVISGRMVIRMRDGSEHRYGAGDAYSVSSDPHDACAWRARSGTSPSNQSAGVVRSSSPEASSSPRTAAAVGSVAAAATSAGSSSEHSAAYVHAR